MKAKNGNRRRRGCARVHTGVRTCMREVGAPEAGDGGRGNEAEEGAEQMGEERRRKRKRKQQKGRRFEKPPSFCIMSVNAMLFLGGEGVKS